MTQTAAVGPSPKPTTHVLIVTDMSGSMADLAVEVRSGFNAYVDGLRKAKAETGARFRLSVTVFDTQFIPLCTAAKLRDVPAFDEKNYQPRGMTALLDAVGKTVAEFEAATTLGADDRVLLVIQTDGQENSSSEYSWTSIRERLEAREKTGQWTVLYLGQGINAWGQGGKFSTGTQSVNTANTRGATMSTYSGLAAATVDYAAGGNPKDVGATVAATPGVNEEPALETK